MYVHVKDRLMTGRPVIVAGSWGSALAEKGVVPDAQLWTSPANLEAPDMVRQVVADWAHAGAHAILVNSYSTGPLLMHGLGRLDDMERMDGRAIGLAREALEDFERPIALAGSFSIHGALARSEAEPEDDLSGRELEILFRRKAAIFKDHGCDFIYMERIRGIRRGLIAVEAAVSTGLPVWVELAIDRAEDGHVCSAGPCRWRFEDMVSSLMSTGAVACIVSHEDPQVIADALQILRMVWAGDQGVSLRNGACVRGRWQQGDLDAEAYLVEAERWRRQGARIYAMTAGTGADIIAPLAEDVARV